MLQTLNRAIFASIILIVVNSATENPNYFFEKKNIEAPVSIKAPPVTVESKTDTFEWDPEPVYKKGFVKHFVLSDSIAQHFIDEGQSIITFYRFARMFQDNEETVALFFAMNDSANLNWMDNREIISSALEDEAKLKKFMSVTVVNEKYHSQYILMLLYDN